MNSMVKKAMIPVFGIVMALGFTGVIGVKDAKAGIVNVDVKGAITPVKDEDKDYGTVFDVFPYDVIFGRVTSDTGTTELQLDYIDKNMVSESGVFRYKNMRIEAFPEAIIGSNQRKKKLILGDGTDLVDTAGNLTLTGNVADIPVICTYPGEMVTLEVPEKVTHEGKYQWYYLEYHELDKSLDTDTTKDCYKYIDYFEYYVVRDVADCVGLAQVGNNLRISSVKHKEGYNGVYLCAKLNDKGLPIGLCAAYHVVVRSGIALTPKKSDMIAKLDEQVTIEVSVTAPYDIEADDTVYYEWLFEGKTIATDVSYSDLVISKMTEDRCGTYTLRVYDAVDMYEVDIEVRSDEVPKIGLISNVNTIARTDTKVAISWDQVSNTVNAPQRYCVFMRNGKSGWKKIGTTNRTTSTIGGLSEATMAYICVRPYIVYQGKVVWATKYKSALIYTTPGNVTYFKSTAATTSAVKVAWGAAKGASGYVVFKEVNGKWVKVGVTTKRYYVFKGLKRGTVRFAVRPYVKVDGKYVFSHKYASLTTSTR